MTFEEKIWRGEPYAPAGTIRAEILTTPGNRTEWTLNIAGAASPTQHVLDSHTIQVAADGY